MLKIFVKEINEPRIKALPGMPVPLKYARNRYALKQLAAKYGNGEIESVVKDLDNSATTDFAGIVSDESIRRSLALAQATVQEQEKTIKSLKDELAALKREKKKD